MDINERLMHINERLMQMEKLRIKLCLDVVKFGKVTNIKDSSEYNFCLTLKNNAEFDVYIKGQKPARRNLFDVKRNFEANKSSFMLSVDKAGMENWNGSLLRSGRKVDICMRFHIRGEGNEDLIYFSYILEYVTVSSIRIEQEFSFRISMDRKSNSGTIEDRVTFADFAE